MPVHLRPHEDAPENYTLDTVALAQVIILENVEPPDESFLVWRNRIVQNRLKTTDAIAENLKHGIEYLNSHPRPYRWTKTL